jgi:salicylate hydroxylase
VSIVHRAALLRELLADVPPGRMHASKKLERIDRGCGSGGPWASAAEPPVTVHFADGIHSIVHGIVLSDGAAHERPRNTGWWATMGLKPYATPQAGLGESLIGTQDQRQ